MFRLRRKREPSFLSSDANEKVRFERTRGGRLETKPSISRGFANVNPSPWVYFCEVSSFFPPHFLGVSLSGEARSVACNQVPCSPRETTKLQIRGQRRRRRRGLGRGERGRRQGRPLVCRYPSVCSPASADGRFTEHVSRLNNQTLHDSDIFGESRIFWGGGFLSFQGCVWRRYTCLPLNLSDLMDRDLHMNDNPWRDVDRTRGSSGSNGEPASQEAIDVCRRNRSGSASHLPVHVAM